MKKTWIILAVIAVVLLLAYSSVKSSYNNMVTMQEGVTAQWSQVENVYQRRADLIPNLVNTVKGYADFEKETLTQVIEARAKATSVNINADNLDAQSLQKFQSAQSGLSSALSKLMVVVEKYPDLKANQGFLDLKAQKTASRLNVKNSTKVHNHTIHLFVSSLRIFLPECSDLRRKPILKLIKEPKKHRKSHFNCA